MSSEHTKLSSLFTPDEVICHLEEMACHQVFRQLIERIAAKNHTVDVETTYQKVLSRDSCGIAFVQPEVAVIHVRIKRLEVLHLAIATSRVGLRCTAAIDGLVCNTNGLASVNIIVLVLAPLDDPTGYLRTIAALNQVCRQDKFIERVLTKKDPSGVWNLFEEAEEYLPAYLLASDIMNESFPSLRDHDSLSDAIDAFCRLGVIELPVLDADGDMVGIASEDELIRICLPEYITWMEDLTPVLNFEPFAEILRHEATVPLVEIMQFSDRYATVDEESPAIQVAKVMMRRDVRQVYVVHGKKLMGVITIQDFIHKVLRA